MRLQSLEKTPFEINDNHTAKYTEIVNYYRMLGEQFAHIEVSDFGMTDAGFPLQEVVIDRDAMKTPAEIRAAGKAIMFINNGIHPGEPCGIDACMMLARDIESMPEMMKALETMSIVIVPVYNIGGCLNRNSYTRTNQVGPESYGFRGNAKNYDLNRDFVKCDSKNAQSFNRLFTKWSPDLFIDTHTSNGADYQYVMTLITTQKDKLPPGLSTYLEKKLEPELYRLMAADRYPMIPYVDEKPDLGISGFLDSGRYSTGYAAMHHVIGFMPETHMLKPFADRVWSTYDFIKHAVTIVGRDAEELMKVKQEAIDFYKNEETIAIDWKMDEESVTEIEFNGFKAKNKKSKIHGKDRLYYDRSEPYTKQIPYTNDFVEETFVKKPSAYIIPVAYSEVVDRLKMNGVHVDRIMEDVEIDVEMYYIEDYKTSSRAYEGHYLHSDIVLRSVQKTIQVRKGDYRIEMNQDANRYILETLEPNTTDSYFAWNLFDGILQQKEYFSSYVFEDLALEWLERSPEIRKKLDEKKSIDKAFADDPRAQLEFIYRRTPHYEYTHNLYPIARVLK